MQEAINKELYNYLTNILNLLFEEKLSSTNAIDSLIASTGTNITNMKECPNCHQQNIENRKKKCPICKIQLPTLTDIQKKKVAKIITNKTNNTFVFKLYSFNDELSVTHILRISITQQRTTDQRVNTPDIYIPDPIDINPNSISNIEKVLLHIEKITGIRDGIRKWMAMICDGVLYHHIIKLKDKFPWLVLIPEPLHEEMNMLRSFVELNW